MTISNISETKEERILKVQKAKWVGYPKANEIISTLISILEFPRTHRMPNLLIIGDTNNGKTVIGKRFESMHPPHFIDAEDPASKTYYQRVVMDVIMIQCPPVPNEKRLYISILDKLQVPYKQSGRIEYFQSAVLKGMSRLGIKVLILDELHHILSGSASKQQEFLQVIKFLSNELEMSIIGIGTKDAFYVINSDDQLANRFEKVVLNKWKYDADYLRLLKTMEQGIQLKEPSNLIEQKIAMRILEMSEGLLGEIATIIRKCAVSAIKSGEEKITLKTLNEIKWTAPSQRRNNSLLQS